MTRNAENFYIIDASSYVFRAYHAIQPLSNSRGEPTNAIYGFCNMILRLIEGKKPNYLAVVFDSKKPSFRKEKFPDYKATREKPPEDISFQIEQCMRVAEGFQFAILQKEGFEADDVIATVKEKLQEVAGVKLVIVSGDKDLMQLIDDRTTLYDSMREKTYGVSEVYEKFGVNPWQLRDLLAIMGDSSDNIPGVKGIGLKGAQVLIQKYGDLETIYSKIDEIISKSTKEKLLASRADAFLSRELVTLRIDVPFSFTISDCLIPDPDRKTLNDLFQRFEFRSLLKKFGCQDTVSSTEQSYAAVTTKTELDELLARLSQSEFIVFDIETTSLSPISAELVGISFSLQPKTAYYVPVGHRNNADQLDRLTVLEAIKPVLENPKIKKCGHNLKYDALVLRKYGIAVNPFSDDTMVISYLLRPGSRGHGIDRLCLDHFNYAKLKYSDLVGSGKNEVTFDHVVVDKACRYCCEDSDFSFRLYSKLMPTLREKGLEALYREIEMPLVEVLAEMECWGVRINSAALQEMSHEMEKRLGKIEKKIFQLVGEEFNINSPAQLGRILFEKLGLPCTKRTKTGMSTNEEVLRKLSVIHDLPKYVLEYRGISKLKSTYVDALPQLVNSKTGRIHASYNQTVTATGRLSSSDPNLQNIPIRTEEGRKIREAFIPADGFRLISADYSQVELRILAHLSGDANLIQAFKDKHDIHTETARAIFGCFDVTEEMRRRAKTVNFGIVYGISDFGLANDLGIERAEAKRIIKEYFVRYPDVRRYLDNILVGAKKTGAVQTLFGRLREIPELNSENVALRSFGERMAINTPIQGTAADLIKMAMIELVKAFRTKNLQAHLIMQVHDELVCEVKDSQVSEAKRVIKAIMEEIYELAVPLTVEISEGANWAEAH